MKTLIAMACFTGAGVLFLASRVILKIIKIEKEIKFTQKNLDRILTPRRDSEKEN